MPRPIDADAARATMADNATALCAGAQKVTFLYVHMPKAAGSSAECSLSTEDRPIAGTRSSKSVWPFAGSVAAAARPGVEMRVVGGHLTFQDFIEGQPSAPAGVRATIPIGLCNGPVWSRGGMHCQPSVSGRPQLQQTRTCTPMVTFLHSPAKRFVSAFYEFYGMRNRRAQTAQNAELVRRYDHGQLTPDELALWPRHDDFAGFLHSAHSEHRNRMFWNTMTQRLGDEKAHKYKSPPASLFGLLPDDEASKAMLSLAKRRLSSLDFVGLADRFHDSMTLLSWWLGLPPLNVTCSANIELKLGLAAANLSKSRPPMGLSPEGIAAVERHNALDVELYAHAEALFNARWKRMLAEAPERVKSDTYRCHGTTRMHCLGDEKVNSLHYKGRRRCSSYCTNPATEEAAIGASLRSAYEEGCPPSAPPPPPRHDVDPPPPPSPRDDAEPVACYLDVRFGREGRPFSWLTTKQPPVTHATQSPSMLVPPSADVSPPPPPPAAQQVTSHHAAASQQPADRFDEVNVTCSSSNMTLRHKRKLYLHSPTNASLWTLTMRIDGVDVLLHPFPTNAANPDRTTGRSSIRWRDAQGRYVLKAIAHSMHGRRELFFKDVCLLKRLRGPSVPRVLCFTDEAMVMENVGPALTVHNLPTDYRLQASRILDAMASRGIKHHDIHRWMSTGAFHTEFMVSSSGQLRLVDFGDASINASRVCESRSDEAAFDHEPNTNWEGVVQRMDPGCKRSKNMLYTCGSDDRDVLGVLDAMYRVNQSLEDYFSSADGIVAMPGVCNNGGMALLKGKDASPLAFASWNTKVGHTYRDASGKFGAFGLQFAAKNGTRADATPSHITSFALGRSIHPGHTPPATHDVQACVQRCRAFSGCKSIAVSSARRVCFWFPSDCKDIFSLHHLGKPDDGATMRLHWYDDFMSVNV